MASQKQKEIVQRVIDKINALKSAIKKDLLTEPELEPFLIRCENSLETMSRALNVAIGGDIEPLSAIAGNGEFIPQPLTAVLDMAVNKVEKTNIDDINPRQAEIEKIKAEVKNVYKSMLEREPKDILEGTDELILRGVAKKAGLNVDANTPETLSVEFVKEIQLAIQNKNEIASKIADAKNAQGELTDDQKQKVDELYQASLDYYKEKFGEPMDDENAEILRGSIEVSIIEGNNGDEQLDAFKKVIDAQFEENDDETGDNELTKAEMIKAINEMKPGANAPKGYAEKLSECHSKNLKPMLHADLTALYNELNEFAAK
jgi:uncharacterized protein YnzC (UPF0291/DUF896 family)